MIAHHNALRPIYDEGRQLMKISWAATAQQFLPPPQYEALVRNDEERNYCQDIIARIGLLADAYDKLCALSADYFEIQEAMQENQSGSGIDLSSVNPLVVQRDRGWKSEVDQSSSLFYYELKSVIDMLKGWGVVIAGAELDYAAKTRNWFLAHPQYEGISRRSARSAGIPSDGGPVELSVSGLNVWAQITRDYYIRELNILPPIDEGAQRAINEQLALSGRKTQQLKPEEILRLKAFGLREPRIRDCTNELAKLCQIEVIPKVTKAFTEALRYGFVRM